MALAIDGHVTGLWSSGTSFTATGLTTINAADVIVAFVSIKGTQTVSSLSTTGVVWQGTARKQYGFAASHDLELWYGTASGTLSNQTTTVNLSGTPTSGAVVSVFGVSGANTSSITDSNVSLPAFNTSTGSVPTVTGVSTSNANDMLIAGSWGGGLTQTAGSGYSLIDSVSSTGVVSVGTEEQVFSSTQSSISVAFGTSAAGTWGILADAIQADFLTAQICC